MLPPRHSGVEYAPRRFEHAKSHAGPRCLAGRCRDQRNAQSGRNESKHQIRLIDFLANVRRESDLATDLYRAVVEVRHALARKQNERLVREGCQRDGWSHAEAVVKWQRDDERLRCDDLAVELVRYRWIDEASVEALVAERRQLRRRGHQGNLQLISRLSPLQPLDDLDETRDIHPMRESNPQTSGCARDGTAHHQGGPIGMRQNFPRLFQEQPPCFCQLDAPLRAMQKLGLQLRLELAYLVT